MILCCGEALIDMLPRQLTSGEDVFLPVPGGALFNTAIALGRLGSETGFFSPLSKDMFGDQLSAALSASNVDAALCPRVDRPTTLAFVKLTDGTASYSFFDEKSALRELSDGELPHLPPSIHALHLGAISLAGEPCGAAFERLMLDNQQCVLSLDPNIRPGFIKDETKYRARLKKLLAVADIIKVSDEDLDWIADEADGEAFIQEWLSANAKIVLVTRGGEGVTAYRANEVKNFPVQKVDVVDTIGAGDTFNAGFLHALNKLGLLTKAKISALDSKSVELAIESATKAAAYVVAQAGANPPWANEVDLPDFSS